MTGSAGECSGWRQCPPVEPEAEETRHPPLPQVQQREVRSERKTADDERYRLSRSKCPSRHLSLILPLSQALSHLLWRDMNCVLSEHGQWHISPPVWTVFARLSRCMQTDDISFGKMCPRACKTVHRAKRGGRDALPPPLSLSLPPPLSLSLSLSLFLTERSLFGSLPLPLRLFPLPGHRCEPTQTPEGFHTSGLQTYTGKTEHKHKQTQAITTPTVEHTCYTDAPASGWRIACEMKNFSGWVNKHDEKCCVVGLKS